MQLSFYLYRIIPQQSLQQSLVLPDSKIIILQFII